MANALARDLRKRLTPQEVRVWQHLRQLRPQGLHFRRQVPLGPFIVDFACKRAKIVVEIDGSQHGMPGPQGRDRGRDHALARDGYTVLRFWNVEVERNLTGVIDTIIMESEARLRR